MRFSAAFLLGAFLLGASGTVACHDRPVERTPDPAHAALTEPGPTSDPASGVRRQPKPGERVPQPELDGYCSGPKREGAFYYHGGSPVVRVAREDGCVPLYITECEAEGQCSAPRDQEPGMWCCATQDEQQNAHAAR
jgi:hypothetical protein